MTRPALRSADPTAGPPRDRLASAGMQACIFQIQVGNLFFFFVNLETPTKFWNLAPVHAIPFLCEVISSAVACSSRKDWEGFPNQWCDSWDR